MGDINHADLFFPQDVHYPKQVANIVRGKGGRRLIKHQHRGIYRYRTGYCQQ